MFNRYTRKHAAGIVENRKLFNRRRKYYVLSPRSVARTIRGIQYRNTRVLNIN